MISRIPTGRLSSAAASSNCRSALASGLSSFWMLLPSAMNPPVTAGTAVVEPIERCAAVYVNRYAARLRRHRQPPPIGDRGSWIVRATELAFERAPTAVDLGL